MSSRNSIGYFHDQSDDDDFDEECWNSKFTVLKVYEDDDYKVTDDADNRPFMENQNVPSVDQRYYTVDELFINIDEHKSSSIGGSYDMIGLKLLQYKNFFSDSHIDYSAIYDQYHHFDSKNLLTEKEYNLFKNNCVPTDKLLVCKYLLFKIVNSKHNEYSLTSNSRTIYGDFLTSEVFIKKEAWDSTSEQCDPLTRLNNFLNDEVILNLADDHSLDIVRVDQKMRQIKEKLVSCDSFLHDFIGLKKLFEMVCCMTNYIIYLKYRLNINMENQPSMHSTFDIITRLLNFIKKYILYSILNTLKMKSVSF